MENLVLGAPLASVTHSDGIEFDLAGDSRLLPIVARSAEFIARWRIPRLFSQVAYAEAQLGGRFSDDAVLYLALVFAIQTARVAQEQTLEAPQPAAVAELQSHAVWAIAQQIAARLNWGVGKPWPEAEVAFITRYLLAAPRNERWPGDLDVDSSFNALLEQMMRHIADYYEFSSPEQDKMLRNGILIHAIPALFRQRFGLWMPAVVGAGSGVLALTSGATVILDGNAGTLTVDPPENALARARAKQEAWQAQLEAALAASDEPAITRDGHRVEVAANIGGPQDAHAAATSGAEAVGLLRTEFLFLGRTTAPTEAEQEQVYDEIVRAMGGRPVIIRTLDIGGDKPLPYVQVPDETNPFLGERGIRLYLARPALLRQQLRAILRAARSGPVRIMFPMVATLDEWRQARAVVEEERRGLVTAEDGAGVPHVELGIMVEIPSAALLADHFAAEVDFFSVGTNDLTQYTLAMDRMHPTLSAQSDGLHPAVLRLIEQTVSAAHDHGKWVGVCGELAADPQAALILIGLGVDELSVSVPAVAPLKAQIRTLNLAEARDLAQRALDCHNAGEVRALSAAVHTKLEQN